MSGCLEGILVDLSEPVTQPEDKENPTNVYDSIELLRDDHCEDPCHANISVLSPGRGGGPILLDITSKTNTPTSDTRLKSPSIATIDKETFDFDLPLTPVTSVSEKSDSVDDEEEVFFGPVGFTERCVASIVTSTTKETKPMSPLNPCQMAEIFKEANAVACRISSAVTTKKSKPIPKVNLFSARKLEMESDNIQVFDPKVVDDLLASVSGHHIDTNVKEVAVSELLVDTDKPVNNVAAIQNTGSDREDKAHVKVSAEEDDCDTPSKRHLRSSTYTVDTTPHDLLPKDKRKSLPMVNNTLQVPTVNSIVSTGGNGVGKETKSASKLKLPVTKLAKGRSSIPGIPSLMKSSVNTQPAKEPEKEEPKPTRSRLSDASKTGFGLKSSLLPSKLSRLPCGKSSLPGPSKSSEKTKPAPAAVAHPAPEPQKSGLPGLRGKLPTTKLQLMRPGALQRSTIASNQTNAANSSTKKPGPMKAFVPTAKTEVKPADPVLPTPAKVEKKVQPKNLLSSSFSTPNRSRGSSASSVDTPASSVKKRRSFLKSPTKSRLSSSGSIPSPCPGRNNSVIVNSRHSSVGEAPYTPVFDGTANPRKRRPSSSSKGKYPSLDKLDDASPSALKPRKALVVNTPNMPRKRVSKWSPVQKQPPHDMMDAAFLCTKKMKR